jgi:Uma2 family endonuclease
MPIELLEEPRTAIVESEESSDDLAERIEIHDREGCEFVDGEWIEKTMSSKSDRVGVNLIGALGLFVDQHRLGLAFGPECGYQIFGDEPKRLRKPDVSFVRSGVLPDDTAPDGNLTVVPELAVEVVSPNEEAVALNQKIIEYLQAGVKLIWVIYPRTRFVEIFRPDGSANWVGAGGKLSGENIVQGFEITFESLFRGA